MTNISFVKNLISQLKSQQVTHFVVCAGARNAPIVEVLTRDPQLHVYSFFEERSAAFFALGCSKRLQAPVAVVTTSGTAVAELLPALIEGYYSGVPLVAITADRPIRLRHSGAPQTIEQNGIFGPYAKAFDLNIQCRDWPVIEKASPTHINVQFDEPLIDEELAGSLR